MSPDARRSLRDVVGVKRTFCYSDDLGPGFIAPLPEYEVEWVDGSKESVSADDYFWFRAAVELNLTDRAT